MATQTTSDCEPVDETSKELINKDQPPPTPILLTGDRRARKRKSLTWKADDMIKKVHTFEHIPDERSKCWKEERAQDSAEQQKANPGSSSAAENASNSIGSTSSPKKSSDGSILRISRISNASVDPPSSNRRSNNRNQDNSGPKIVEYFKWRFVLIDFTPELSAPGWNSVERTAQAERETYVLGAIDLPGQASTLDEPEQLPKSSTPTSSNITNKDQIVEPENIIPLDNKEGAYQEWPDMYTSEFVNGVRPPNDGPIPAMQNIAAFCNQTQSQMLAIGSNQQQQKQLVQSQAPFNTFQDLATPFQQQAPLQLQPFPFQAQQQQQQPQQQQQSLAPFGLNAIQLQAAQLQTQQQNQSQHQPPPFVSPPSTLSGPIMPWLTYPFSQVGDNSHVQLFRRPT